MASFRANSASSTSRNCGFEAALATQGRDNLPCSFIVPAMTPAIERQNIAEIRMFGTGQVPSDRSVQILNAARFERM